MKQIRIRSHQNRHPENQNVLSKYHNYLPKAKAYLKGQHSINRESKLNLRRSKSILAGRKLTNRGHQIFLQGPKINSRRIKIDSPQRPKTNSQRPENSGWRLVVRLSLDLKVDFKVTGNMYQIYCI